MVKNGRLYICDENSYASALYLVNQLGSVFVTAIDFSDLNNYLGAIRTSMAHSYEWLFEEFQKCAGDDDFPYDKYSGITVDNLQKVSTQVSIAGAILVNVKVVKEVVCERALMTDMEYGVAGDIRFTFTTEKIEKKLSDIMAGESC